MAILSLSLSQKHRRNAIGSTGTPRFLITVSVLGSAGPIRFVASEGDTVATVIAAALRSYARQGRRPVLGSDPGDFVLHRTNAGFDVLSPSEKISSSWSRAFVLCRKQEVVMPSPKQPAERAAGTVPITGRTSLERKGSGGILKAWFTNLRISSH